MIVMNMSGAYEPQNFYEENNVEATVVDCRDIAGTRCYLDEVAGDEIRRRIADLPVSDVHFLDSGNYHYLSLLWLEKINEPFSLVLLDNHPDLQPPSFGEITSCGGWLKEAIDNLSNLKRVYMVGVRCDLLDALELPDCVVLDLNQLTSEDLPIYISFDKDVLSSEYARTDWDQGTMLLDDALALIAEIKKHHRIIGMDVCGEDSGWENAADASEIIRINNQSNAKIYSII